MATEILLEKIEDSLHPVDEEGKIALRAFKDGAIVKVSFSVPRSVPNHRHFRAIAKLTFDNQDGPEPIPSVDDLIDALKMAVGYKKRCYRIDGSYFEVPDSLSFGACDEIKFRQVKDAIIRYIADNIIPRVNNRDFERQFYELLREPTINQLERA
jgi:hypothetical protein